MAGEVEVVPDGSDDPDYEVLVVKDDEPLEEPAVEEPKVEGRVLTQAEYDELVRRGESTIALTQPLTSLVERMGNQQPANVQQPGETDEEFYARMETEAFLPGKFGEVMRKVGERQNAPIVNRMAGIILDQAKQIIRMDPEKGPNFRKYQAEIEKEAQGLAQTPDLYDQAYQRVMWRKQPEIMNEARVSMKEELKKELIAELGLEVGAEGAGSRKPARQAVSSLGQRSVANVGSAAEKTVKLFESERDRMMNAGMDPRDSIAVQAWLKSHPRRK